MTIIKTYFESGNPDHLIIRGYEMHEEGREGVLPAVICSHGFTSDIRETVPYAEVIAEEGFRAFVYDFCGGGFASKSDGSFEDYMTPLTEREDLKSVLKYVQKREDVDSQKIAFLGGSQGGFVSMLAAAQVKDEIAGLCLMYPALCIPDDARRGSMQILRFNPQNIPDHIGVSPMRICGDYARTSQQINVDEMLKAYTGPVLLEHGTADQIVPFSYAEHAKEVYEENGNDLLYHAVKDSPHGFNGKYFTEACEPLKEFLHRIF